MWMRTLVSLLAALALAACGSNPPVTDGGAGGGGGLTGGGGGQTGGGGGGGVGGGGGGGDVIAPFIRSTSPGSGATDQPLEAPFLVAFSEPMDVATVTVSLYPPVALGPNEFDAERTTLTVVPVAPLVPATLYTVTVDGEDPAGNMLAGLRTFAFTTRVVDVTPPTLEATEPAANATNVPIGSSLAITFSEPMNLATVAIQVVPSANLGPAVWTDENQTVTLTPSSPLAPTTVYTVTIAGQDLAGLDLTGSATFSFTTGVAPDVTPPTVLDTSPGDGENDVSNNALITIHFSEPMRTVDTVAALQLAAGATRQPNCDGRWLWNTPRTMVSCQPVPALTFSTLYRVTVGVGAKDDAGLEFAAPYVFSFTVGVAPDTTPPTVAAVSPGLGTIGVERTAFVQVNFSEGMDTTATQGAFNCAVGATAVGGTFAWYTRNKVVRFTPSSPFINGVTVSCAVRGGSGGARDAAGNRLATNYGWTFRVLRAGAMSAPPIATLDGFVFNSGTTSASLGSAYVGDTSTNLGSRGFFAFSLAGLPGEARRITSAALSLHFLGPVGAPSSLGSLSLEHLDYGASLTGSDYSASALSSGVWATPLIAGLHAVTVSSSVQNDFLNRASRGDRVEFRLRFSLDVTADAASDGVYVATTEWATATQRPSLSVAFEYP